MKKLLKFIPLAVVSLLTIGCGSGATSSLEPVSEETPTSIVDPTSVEPASEEAPTSVEETSEEPVSQETEEEKALREAKEAAEAFILTVDVELYRGEEKVELEGLLAALTNLISTATAPNQLSAAISGIESYLETAKTKAEYEQEEAEAAQKAFEEAKAAMLAKAAPLTSNIYREEEKANYNTVASALYDAINACTTQDELDAISFTSFNNTVSQLKTQAEFTMNELLNHHLPSEWDLVNEHVKNWEVVSPTKIHHNTIGNSDIAYSLTEHVYHDGFEAVIKCENPGTTSINQGILIVNPSATGTGLDGYWVNVDYAPDHQYLQVYFVKNGYAIESTIQFDYVGGWVYQNEYQTKLNQDDIRVIYDGEHVTFYNNADYLVRGEEAPHVVVDLAYYGNYAANLTDGYHFGYYNWDDVNGQKNFELKEFAPKENLSGREILSEIWAKDKENFESIRSLYEQDEQNQIDQVISSVDGFLAESNYVGYTVIDAAIKAYRDVLATTKTHEQKETERHADIATTVLDNMYSGDTSKYTPSNWDLVNEHALAWTHTQGSNTLVTDGLAGYIMDNEVHGDFTMVFSLDGVQPTNPYGGAGAFKALCFGCTMGANEYFSGYAITLSETNGDNWIQIHKLDSSTGIGTNSSTFIGGRGMSVNNVKFRVTVINNVLKLYLVDGTNETQLGLIDAGFNNVNELSVPNAGGKFAILDWGDTPTTYTLYEYRNL